MQIAIQEKITCKDFQIPTRDGQAIPIRVYRPKSLSDDILLPVYLYFHGGGFLFGTLNSEDANCERIVACLDIVVVNVCYRHTPLFKHPTQANDAWDAFQWVSSHFDAIGGDKDQLIVGGTSAGGSLASSVVMKENMTKQGHIKGQVLCIPQLINPGIVPPEVSSYRQHAKAPIIPRSQLNLFGSVLGADDLSDTTLFVGSCLSGAVVGMPKTAFLVAGIDPLRDEALLYAEKLKNNR
jgi:acetyl esterase/lipase